jgi:glycosyltransferase involved in cell wall biosynthesis
MAGKSTATTDLISIVLPAYNEELGVKKTIETIPYKKLAAMGFTIEVVVVDNNSSDNTARIARKMMARVVSEKKQGYGYAYKKGFTIARGTIVVACDADGTYPLAMLPELLKIFRKEHLDMLLTNRFSGSFLQLKTMPHANRFGNLILSSLFRALFIPELRDSQSGMWIMKKELFSKLSLRTNQMAFSQEIKIEAVYYQRCHWRQVNIPYDLRVGKKKLLPVRHGIANTLFLFHKRFFR